MTVNYCPENCIVDDVKAFSTTEISREIIFKYDSKSGDLTCMGNNKDVSKYKEISDIVPEIERKVGLIYGEEMIKMARKHVKEHYFRTVSNDWLNVKKVDSTVTFSIKIPIVMCKCHKHDLWGYAACSPQDFYDFATGVDEARMRLYLAHVVSDDGIKDKEYVIRGAFDVNKKMDRVFGKAKTKEEIIENRLKIKQRKKEKNSMVPGKNDSIFDEAMHDLQDK